MSNVCEKPETDKISPLSWQKGGAILAGGGNTGCAREDPGWGGADARLVHGKLFADNDPSLFDTSKSVVGVEWS